MTIFLSINKVKRAVGCLSVRIAVSASAVAEVWTDRLCAASHGRSFSSLWAAFTLIAQINALYNEMVYGKEEHAT